MMAMAPDADLLASLLEESPLAIDVKDRDGRYLRLSPAGATLLGLRRPEEAIGRTAADFLSADGARSAQVDEQAVMRTGRPIVDVERREAHTDGRLSWWSISRQPLRDGAGEIVGTVGFARDITRRKAADEALRNSNERLKRVIATQRELAASALDLNAVTQVVVERAQELTGADGATVQLVDGDELLTRARSGADVGLSARRSIAAGVELHALRHGRPLLLREVAKDPRVPAGGHGAAHSLVCAPFFHAGVPAGTVDVFVTATDRVLDEHDRNTVALLAQMLSTALSQAAEFTAKRTQVETLARFEATFHGAPIGIAMVTADGAIATCNPAFHELVGRSPDELGMVTLNHDLIEDPDPRRFDELMSGARDRYRVEARVRRSDGALVWGDASFALVRDAGGDPTFAVVMVKDISARKRAEAERDRMELELRLAQKLESIGQLTAGIAHEINTPIQFVGDTIHFLSEAFGDLMRLEDVQQRLRAAAHGTVDAALLAEVAAAVEAADLSYLRERVPGALERGLGGIQRVSTIVAAMRAFAHPPSATYAPTDLNEALENTLVVARGEYAAVAEVETDLGELPAVTCNAGEINQVLLNLVINAAHAIEDVVGDGGGRGNISVRTRAEDEHVVVTIADSGGGIPEDVAGRVFDPFFTTKEVGRGTGQGLAIARTIVAERHGGELTFDSEPGVGTAFHVRLPISSGV